MPLQFGRSLAHIVNAVVWPVVLVIRNTDAQARRPPDDQRKRPIPVGNLTDNVIYDRLAPGVKQRLKELIGRDESGRLKKKMFQR
jgi:hypothetical protein